MLSGGSARAFAPKILNSNVSFTCSQGNLLSFPLFEIALVPPCCELVSRELTRAVAGVRGYCTGSFFFPLAHDQKAGKVVNLQGLSKGRPKKRTAQQSKRDWLAHTVKFCGEAGISARSEAVTAAATVTMMPVARRMVILF